MKIDSTYLVLTIRKVKKLKYQFSILFVNKSRYFDNFDFHKVTLIFFFVRCHFHKTFLKYCVTYETKTKIKLKMFKIKLNFYVGKLQVFFLFLYP